MMSKISGAFSQIFRVDPQERIKLLMLTITYFLVIASYTIVQAMKDAIFLHVVGEDWLGWVSIASIFVLIPAILFYSYMVDRIRSYQLLYVYSLFYGIVGLIFAYYIGDPQIGIANTTCSSIRVFGWLFYFFVQGYSPFVISLFWSFANSITDPKQAKDTYGLMVSGSKLGGAISALIAWYLFSSIAPNCNGVFQYQVLMLMSFGCLCLVPISIFVLTKVVPAKNMHGYEAVYRAQKQQEKSHKKEGLCSGLKIMLKQPYVLGIFSIIFFYEIIHQVVNYQRLIFANQEASHIASLSSKLFYQWFWIHLIGFAISLLGTNLLLRKLGERRCLLMIPIITGGLVLLYTLNNTFNLFNSVTFVSWVFISLKSLNYAISYPIRESLYIPTVKDIKFKSKSWIDSFGSRFSKAFGGSFNIFSKSLHSSYGMGAFLFSQYVFFSIVVFLWVVAAYLLGKKYQKTIDNNEVIGLPEA